MLIVCSFWVQKDTLLCCLLMFSGSKYENLVKRFKKSVRFVKMLKIAHKHLQVCWNPYPLLINGLDHGRWTLSLGYLLVQMVAKPFSPVLIV